MKTILLILLFFVLNNASHSQIGWVKSDYNTSNKLNNAFFINVNTGWICGDEGLIIKTTDKGLTWNIINSNTISALRSIYFLNEETGWAVGGNIDPRHEEFSDMVILKTTNSGENWSNIYNGTDHSNVLNCVYFFDENTGVALGGGGHWSNTTGVARRTTDGGLNWSLDNVPYTVKVIADKKGNLWALSYYFDDTGGDETYILRSTDKGCSWDTILVSNYSNFFDIDLNSNSDPLILCDSLKTNFFLTSTNSGLTWTDKPFYLSDIRFISKIYYRGRSGNKFEYLDDNNIWLAAPHEELYKDNEKVSPRSSIYYSNDNGLKWSEQINFAPDFISKILITDSQHGICIVSRNKIYITSNGGK